MTEPKLTDWKDMYGALWRIRLFEGHVQRLAAAGEIPGFPHLSTGQEAVAVGVCARNPYTIENNAITSKIVDLPKRIRASSGTFRALAKVSD